MSFHISIIGSGIIGAITSLMIFLFNKNEKIFVFESYKKITQENSKVLNNAGTGHEGMCENNYILKINNNVFIKKNILINKKFNNTKNFLSWIKYLNLFKLNFLITKIPHVAYFYLNKNKIKLNKIFSKIRKFNKIIKFTNNLFMINKIYPLLLKNKKIKKKFSITYYKNGFDINYELISKKIFVFLSKKKNFFLYLNCEILKIKKKGFFFCLYIKKKKMLKLLFKNVFICAGGSSLELMKKFNNKIVNKYLNLPISGLWLICEEKKKIKNHNIKVYSQTLKINPPMSIPHLDLRKIKNEKKILFGPFAGITFNILVTKKKNILTNINFKNIVELIVYSYNNFYLINYLITESLKSKKKKKKSILPFCNIKKMYQKTAGKRLQIIKKEKNFLKVNFGTKLIFGKKKKIVVLLGASPGASISANIAIRVVKKWKLINNNFLFKKKKNNIINNILYRI